MKTILIILVFLLINAFFIISNNNLALNNSDNLASLATNYFNWLEKIGNNLTTITGNIIRLNWMPN
ncbi:hypothetical protein HYW74_02780 [Candidatus Pacearchaeota archaeon]|nr:hypothetical protein [Candidatus Pacearchaeota archaeon]